MNNARVGKEHKMTFGCLALNFGHGVPAPPPRTQEDALCLSLSRSPLAPRTPQPAEREPGVPRGTSRDGSGQVPLGTRGRHWMWRNRQSLEVVWRIT